MSHLDLGRGGRDTAAASLTPCQVDTKRDFRVATDFRVAQLLKHQPPSQFHSLAEYYHAALLEGDPTVSRYVPQPFMLTIGKRRRYVPDCYVVRDGQVEVVELKPRGKFDEHRCEALEAYFRNQRIRFLAIPNEAVFSRVIEARNWLLIVQMLVIHCELDTAKWEMNLFDRVRQQGSTRLADWVLRQDRSSSRVQEIALLRLLHQGKLRADLTRERFSYATEVRPCR